MKRREFLEKTAAAVVLVNSLSLLDVFASSSGNPSDLKPIRRQDLAPPSDALQAEFKKLISWMKDEGWTGFIQKSLGLNMLDLQQMTDEQLCGILPGIADISNKPGIEDFAGNKLIEPGDPARSLLYHLLASPRVKSPALKSYPSINQLDTLENYIYSLKALSAYQLTPGSTFLAVLAYEYRPAYKVPTMDPNHTEFEKAADLVFSRTGIARIGDKPLHYDPQNRCFVNQPEDQSQNKSIAVTAARYGLFLVELVEVSQGSGDSVKVMNYQDVEYTRRGNMHVNRRFIRPIRKLFNDDSIEVKFSEYHVNEKLFRLSKFSLEGQKIELSDPNFEVEKPPFRRVSCLSDQGKPDLTLHSTDAPMVKLARRGSSCILSAAPDVLIREAVQNDKIISFRVPELWKENNTSNRRYSAFKVTEKKTKEVNDAIWTDFIYRRNRRTSRFRAPKNAPLFVNIKTEVLNNVSTHIGPETFDFDRKINGRYWAKLFEDSICDGCVAARIILKEKDKKVAVLSALGEPMPAFSLVTAPDFFPYLDSNDVRAYYFSKGMEADEDFLEGGTINLSGIRQRGNPNIMNPFTGRPAFESSSADNASFDTLTAVVAANTGAQNQNFKPLDDYSLSYKRDYRSTSFLPDTGTGIFFPGWDATYSGQTVNPYLATFGLGSPFPEDMKLCAAANGMWPVSSPDAGRTFQGSLEEFPVLGRPTTSIPLMDIEIGIHPSSAAHLHYKMPAGFGWDGEQGPFLVVTPKGISVNFTDISRADYLTNLLDPSIGFDMSQLRNLESTELIRRMDCLRKCIRAIENRQVQKTSLWLVGAQRMSWDSPAIVYSIPPDLVAGYSSWATRQSVELEGEGYLYTFVKAEGRKKQPIQWDGPNSKRRWLPCDVVYVCQVTPQAVAICKVKGNKPVSAEDVSWKIYV